jgi:uncharacterized membrane protein YraQ (UPF0718 family)
VKALPAWLKYSVLRVLFILVPLVLMIVFGVNWVIATIAAVIIGLCLSYIFLRRRREATSAELYTIATRKRTPVTIDDDIEDAAIDAAKSADDADAAAAADAATKAAPARRQVPEDD